MRSNLCAFLAVTLAVSAASTPAAPPTIYNLGTLGGALSSGLAVNDAGQVAGTSYLTGLSARHAFRYDGTSGSGAAINESFVPEPSVLGLLALAVPTLLRRRHRSHSACVRNSLVEA